MDWAASRMPSAEFQGITGSLERSEFGTQEYHPCHLVSGITAEGAKNIPLGRGEEQEGRAFSSLPFSQSLFSRLSPGFQPGSV